MRSVALVLLSLLLGGMGASGAWANREYVRERLAALKAAPFEGIATTARREEVVLIWEELADKRDRLPRVYGFVSMFMSRFATRLYEESRAGRRSRESDAALALLHYAGLSIHDRGYQTRRFERHPVHLPLYRGAIERLDGGTTPRNYRMRMLCMAVFSHSEWDPPLELRSTKDFTPRFPSGGFRSGRFAARRLFPFTDALASSLDRDLERVRTRLAPPPVSIPSSTPSSAPATTPRTAPAALMPVKPVTPPRRRGGLRLRPWMVVVALLLSAGTGFLVARRTAQPAEPALPPPPPAPAASPGEPSSVLQNMEALEDVRARVVHSLTGRLAIARVLQDEPERFCEAFLTPETLEESAGLLDGEEGLVPMVERLKAEDLSATPGIEGAVGKLAAELPRYRKLSAHMRRFEAEVREGRVPKDVPKFQQTLIKVAKHFKDVNQALRAALGRYRLDTEALLEERAEGFRGRLEVELDARAETDVTTLDRKGLLKDLEVVLDCLLENAFQATARKVSVRWEAAEGEVRMVLVDDGQGLEGHDPEELFQEGMTTKTLGTGTGLAKCRKLLRSRGGSISLAQDGGGGARVTLGLPLSPPRS